MGESKDKQEPAGTSWNPPETGPWNPHWYPSASSLQLSCERHVLGTFRLGGKHSPGPGIIELKEEIWEDLEELWAQLLYINHVNQQRRLSCNSSETLPDLPRIEKIDVSLPPSKSWQNISCGIATQNYAERIWEIGFQLSLIATM